ncbi:MAG TPA: hypothetical protein DGG95_13740 [Cytophagales bacterium]|jgi:uncharacterized protein (DUF2141 family)|nr:hypothetical protein [Cytophagales bacterium]
MVKIGLLILLLVPIRICTYAQTGKVNIEVKGIDLKAGGILHVAIFEKANFPKTGKHTLGWSKGINGATMQVTFEQVPIGQYAIAVFQDKDQNKKLNTNFFGYPIEPMGFSNDAKLKFGPPSFDDAKIIVAQDQTLNLVIHLH